MIYIQVYAWSAVAFFIPAYIFAIRVMTFDNAPTKDVTEDGMIGLGTIFLAVLIAATWPIGLTAYLITTIKRGVEK